MSNVSLVSVLVAAMAATVGGCGSGVAPDYSNCGSVSQFGECQPDPLCDSRCDCVGQLGGDFEDVELCLGLCAAVVREASSECLNCLGQATCEELVGDGEGACDALCDLDDVPENDPAVR